MNGIILIARSAGFSALTTLMTKPDSPRPSRYCRWTQCAHHEEYMKNPTSLSQNVDTVDAVHSTQVSVSTRMLFVRCLCLNRAARDGTREHRPCHCS